MLHVSFLLGSITTVLIPLVSGVRLSLIQSFSLVTDSSTYLQIMHSKTFLSLALSAFVVNSAVASPCKPPSSAASKYSFISGNISDVDVNIFLGSLTVTTLSESTTMILPVSSSTETSILDTTLASQTTETSEAVTTATTSATSVDTSTADNKPSSTLLDTTIATEATTTTAGEVTTTAAETTTAATAGCPQVTVLANPTSIFSSSEGTVFDDEHRTVVTPFDVEVFGAFSSTVHVSVNGLLTLGRAPNTASFNAELPAQSLPEVSIMPYWDDLLVFPDLCGSGITYEIYDTSRGQTFTVEYYVGSYNNPVGEHFTVSMYKDYPGLVRYVYYKTSRHGSSATVGVQNGIFKSQYSYNAEDSIPDRFWVEIDTSNVQDVTTSDGDLQGGN